MHIRLLFIGLTFVSSVQAACIHGTIDASLPRENVIKRYMFSANNIAGIQTEFDKLKVRICDQQKALSSSFPARMTGTGASGYPTPYLVEHVNE
jgi:hypothetical protein